MKCKVKFAAKKPSAGGGGLGGSEVQGQIHGKKLSAGGGGLTSSGAQGQICGKKALRGEAESLIPGRQKLPQIQQV